MSVSVDVPSSPGHHATPPSTCQLGKPRTALQRLENRSASQAVSREAGGRSSQEPRGRCQLSAEPYTEGSCEAPRARGEPVLSCSARSLQTARICSSPFPTPQPNSPAASSSESHGKQRSSRRAPVAANRGYHGADSALRAGYPVGARGCKPFCVLLLALHQPWDVRGASDLRACIVHAASPAADTPC